MKKKDDSGYVYIFATDSVPGWVKIGKSRDWRIRLKNGNTYVPDDFRVIATLKTSEMSNVEADMHELVGNHERVKKEFFCVDCEVAANDLRIIARTRGESSGFTLYRNGIPAEGCGKDGVSEGIALPEPLRDATFHPTAKGADIRMRVLGADRFTVLSGSVLEPVKDGLAYPKTPAAESLRLDRMALELDPATVKDGRLLHDVDFPSPSRALAVMLGYAAAQGTQRWIDDGGKPLADYL